MDLGAARAGRRLEPNRVVVLELRVPRRTPFDPCGLDYFERRLQGDRLLAPEVDGEFEWTIRASQARRGEHVERSDGCNGGSCDCQASPVGIFLARGRAERRQIDS